MYGLTVKDLKLLDVLVFIPIFEENKKLKNTKLYIVKKIKDKSIICDIIKYYDPHSQKMWTEIPINYIKNYIKYKDLVKIKPQYFI